MISKILKTLDCSGYTAPKRLFNKVTDTVEGGIKTLENMPEKRDLIQNKRVVAVNGAMSMSNCVFGLEGFPEKVVELSDIVEKKLSKYMRILPESSKMQKPLQFSIEGTPFELMVDKSKKDISHVTVKQFIPVQDVLKNKNSATILNIEFDKSGKMMSGSLMMGDSHVSEAYRFSRTGKNIRRIDYEQVYKGHSYNKTSFMPVSNQGTWTPIKDNLNRCGAELPDLSSAAVAGDPLGYLFFNLAGLKKTL